MFSLLDISSAMSRGSNILMFSSGCDEKGGLVQAKRTRSWLCNAGQDYQNHASMTSRQIMREHTGMIKAVRDHILRQLCEFLRGKKSEASKESGVWIDGVNRLPLDITLQN